MAPERSVGMADSDRPADPDDQTLGTRALRGSLWNLVAFGLNKGALLVTTIVVTRLLSVEEMGVWALAVELGLPGSKATAVAGPGFNRSPALGVCRASQLPAPPAVRPEISNQFTPRLPVT